MKSIFVFLSAIFALLNFTGQAWGEGIQGGSTVKENAKLEVVEIQGGVTVDTGAVRFELRNGGVLRSLYIGDKALVADAEYLRIKNLQP